MDCLAPMFQPTSAVTAFAIQLKLPSLPTSFCTVTAGPLGITLKTAQSSHKPLPLTTTVVTTTEMETTEMEPTEMETITTEPTETEATTGPRRLLLAQPLDSALATSLRSSPPLPAKTPPNSPP
eukprot:PhF_6_TR882/c5_g1_i1/m.1323